MTDKQYVINEIAASESWRMFHIMAEFVEGFETLGKYRPSVSISDPHESDRGRGLPEGGANRPAPRGGWLWCHHGGGPGVMEAANKGAASAGATPSA